jgi:hypothetical protein
MIGDDDLGKIPCAHHEVFEAQYGNLRSCQEVFKRVHPFLLCTNPKEYCWH